jgi:outer membrane protein
LKWKNLPFSKETTFKQHFLMKTKLPFYLLIACLGGSLLQGASIESRATLPTLLNYALEHSFDILNAKEQIEEQEGLIVEIKAQVLPNANVSASYSKKDEALIVGEILPSTSPDEFWDITVEVSQLVYSGGSIRSTLKAQKFAREAVQYSLEAVVNNLALSVTESFYNALLARESISVQEENVAFLERQLENVRNRFEAQTVSKFEVLQAEVELANAQPGLIRARNAYRIALDELYRIVGYTNRSASSYTGNEIEGELDYSPLNYSLNRALENAIEQRPEMDQLKAIIEARKSGVDVARAGYFPNVSVYGNWGIQKSPLSSDVDDSLRGWEVGVRSSWSIFDGRATRGRIIQARSQLRRSENDQRELKLAIENEVRRSVSALQEASELSDAAGKVVEQAEEALRLADVRFQAGNATQLELLQSQTAVTSAKLNQLEANYSYLVATAQFKRATGVFAQ